MKINFNLQGAEKKAFVKAIAEHLEEKAVYQGTPSCAYQIGDFTVTRDGALEFSDNSDSEIVESLLDAIEAAGFEFPESAEGTETEDSEEEATEEAPETDCTETDAAESSTEANENPDSETEEPSSLTISVPALEPDAMERLIRLVDSKASLIKKALGVTHLEIRIRDGKLEFPWFDRIPTPEETAAYMAFFAGLCRMAKEAKRVTATDKPVESEKYAFRIFLLRMGFNGKDNAAVRYQLLKNLSGHAAFRNAEEAEKFKARMKEKRQNARAEASSEEEISNEITE